MPAAPPVEDTGLRTRVPTLDGLRGIAVLAVVYVHLTNYMGLLEQPGGGFIGVAVFFVLSGYLITNILWRDPAELSAAGYRRFIGKRARRLFPALAGLVVIGGPLLVLSGERIAEAVKGAALALSQLTALYYGSGHHVDAPWSPAWSLSIEWTFYLCWPLLLIGLRRREVDTAAARRIALIFAAALYAVALPLSAQQFYNFPLANVSVLLCGSALAFTHMHQQERGEVPGGREAPVVALALVLIAAITLLPGAGTIGPLYRFVMLPAGVLAALIVIDSKPAEDGVASRILAMRPLRTAGRWGYSVYLWHVPVMWCTWFALPDMPALVRAAIALMILVPVSWASFTWLERPWVGSR